MAIILLGSILVFRVDKKLPMYYFFLMQFIYVNQSFAPSPDQEVGTLYEVTTSLQNYFYLLW